MTVDAAMRLMKRVGLSRDGMGAEHRKIGALMRERDGRSPRRWLQSLPPDRRAETERLLRLYADDGNNPLQSKRSA